MARIATLLALGAAGGLIASCAGARPAVPESGTTHRASAPAHPVPGGALTASAAGAFARAVNLQATDVPGFKASSKQEHETVKERLLQRKLLSCVGGGNAERGLAEAGSPSFQRESGILQQGVSSNVSVARSSAAATRELAELRSRHTRGCLQAYLDLLFKGPTFHAGLVDHVSISLGIPPAFGTTGSFAWRITVGFTVHSIRIPFYLDVLGFVYGPAQVTLLSSGFPLPFPAAAEEQLFSLLVARAKAQGV